MPTHQATGSRSAGGTTTVAPAYPAGVASGRLAVVSRVIKPETATGDTETGWTQQISATGGTGTTGVDAGPTRIVVGTRVLDGSETGSVTFDNSNSPNSSHAVISIYTLLTGSSWDIVATAGDDAGHAAGRSATATSSTALAPGDMVLAICGSDTDASGTAFTSPAITASGITFGTTTERLGVGGVGTGNDTGLYIYEAEVSSGTATAALALSLSSGVNNCGPVAFIRLREVTGGDVNVSAVAATATAAAGVPSIASGTAITAVAATATASAGVPSITTDVNVIATAAVATAAAGVPTVSAGATFTAAPSSITAVAGVPTIESGTSLTSQAATATALAGVPSIAAGSAVQGVAATATATAGVPTVDNGVEDRDVTVISIVEATRRVTFTEATRRVTFTEAP